VKIRRRELLKGAGGAIALLAAGCGAEDAPIADQAAFPDGLVIAPEPGGAHLVAMVQGLRGVPRLLVEVAAGVEPVASALVEVPALPADVPLHLRLPLDVAPSTRLQVRLRARRGETAGWFRTLPAPDDARPARVALFSCQGWQAGYFAAHRGMAAEELDLVVSLGDYIYELTDDTGPPDRVDAIGVNRDGFAETLDEYRQKYRLYRSDPDLRAMHAAHGFVGVWDSHELADDGAEHLDGKVPRVPLAERNANGRAAFWDFMPMDPGPADRPLYRSLRVGANLEIFLLDLHTHAEPPGATASYLGAAQRDWLFAGLASSPARWKLIASSTVMMGLDLSAGMPLNLRQWDGYPGERRALVEHARGVGGVVAVSGDLHTFLAAPVTTTGRQDGEAGLVEVCAGAISSQGLFDLAPHQTEAARGLEALARQVNPHLTFIDVLARGYAVVEAGADELRVTLRSPENVHQRGSPVRDLARFRVAAGATALERL
jgi:alkaline phosphatase D